MGVGQCTPKSTPHIQLPPPQDAGLRLPHLQGLNGRSASLKPSGVGPVTLTQGTLVFCGCRYLSLMGIGLGCAAPSVGPLYFLHTEHSPFLSGSEVLALPVPRPASPAPFPLAEKYLGLFGPGREGACGLLSHRKPAKSQPTRARQA